ncbi:50S ribosomal protein L9 [Clostridium estertheticum]|uniref:50S ribosomal protein L9 n=1 Tax=Clostridium estertheticum TaxID=238834 RepID=UPI001C7CC951|nr:50S ribosomal protein L9 [Clostridium estertheticum]MBX4262025.1 50S ribosomal protein L9 [Clostridium estertheticum]WLC70181.1 50S ribosomal protein L9 [Clostridium estertheticum]
MKIILLKDIKSMGKKGDVVNAADGYARNYLFPRKLAEEATDPNMHILNKKNDIERKKKTSEIEDAQTTANALKDKVVKIIGKAGENGKLFGAITSKDIASALNKQCNLDIDKKKVVTDTIKLLGTYDVEIKIYPEISTKIKVLVCEE